MWKIMMKVWIIPLYLYLDANTLYGHAMNRPFPYKDFEWVDSISIDTIMNDDENSDVGYTLEVDLHYPKELHDLHNKYKSKNKSQK